MPAILFTVYGLAWSVPLPSLLRHTIDIDGIGYANLASLVLLAGLLFYLSLSWAISVGIALVSIGFLALLGWLEHTGIDILTLSLVVFILAWIGQFIGHKFEGKKPSFFQDLQFLLIGPALTLAALYRALGIPY